MGGYFTSSRTEFNLRNKGMFIYTSNGARWPVFKTVDSHYGVSPSDVIALPTQSTTSWRTGRGYVSNEDNRLAEALDREPTILAGEFGFIQSMDDDSGSSVSSTYDTGHTFSTIRHWVELSHPKVDLSTSSGVTYSGPLIPEDTISVPTGQRWIDPPAFGNTNVGKYGSWAISATAPTNPASSFGVGFFETLKDGLPKVPWSILHTGESFLRNLSHGHLGVQFDYLPFIADFRSTLHALLNASSILKQYQRDSGRMVRRSYHFPLERTVISSLTNSSGQKKLHFPTGHASSDGDGWWAGPNTPITNYCTSQGSSVTGRCEVVRTQERRIYFKGAYSYFLPSGDSFFSRLDEWERKANHLLGLELTPALLWELAPWSWLLDWKLHMGRMLTTYSALHTDGLVVRYGYLMVTTTYRNTISFTNVPVTQKGKTTFMSPSVTYVSQRKERFRATPYGFGIDPNGFTARQWSILAALGMTRSPKSLRTD